MSDCIFCKIIDGEIPSRKVFEDQEVIAIMDQSQATPGHTLLIPKKHVRNIFDYDESLASIVFSRLPKISKAIRKSNSDVKGLNILVNNEPIAYQTVFHSHVHLIPRYSENDGLSISFADNSDTYSDEELDQISKQIVSSMEEK